jgi:hypothetical protein
MMCEFGGNLEEEAMKLIVLEPLSALSIASLKKQSTCEKNSEV